MLLQILVNHAARRLDKYIVSKDLSCVFYICYAFGVIRAAVT